MTVKTSYLNQGGVDANGVGSYTISTFGTISLTGAVATWFNGSEANTRWFNSATAGSSGFKIDFGSGVKKLIDGFSFHASNNTDCGSWRLYGSNDDSTYTALGAAAFTWAGNSGRRVFLYISNTTTYRYYKIQLESGSVSSSPFQYDLRFRIADDSGSDSNTFGIGLVSPQTSTGGTSITTNKVATNLDDAIIVVALFNEKTGDPGKITSLSSTNISSGSWTKRTQQRHTDANNSHQLNMELWWAPAPATPLNGEAITINVDQTMDDTTVCVFTVVGADATVPFDTNASLPGTMTSRDNIGAGTTPTISGISTSAANTILFGFVGTSISTMGTSPTPATGYTTLAYIDNSGGANWGRSYMEFKKVTATQSSVSITATTSPTEWVMIADAIRQQAGPSGTLAATEAKDVFAGSGSLIGGSWASTEAQDTFYAVTGVVGTWTSTEIQDLWASYGSLIGGSWASTEAKDLFAGTGWGPPPYGTLAATEAKDTFAGTAIDIGIDGTASNQSTTSSITTGSVTLTTTQTNDVIVLCVTTRGGAVTSVADVAGLTWTRRKQFHPATDSASDMEIWWAHAPAALSADVITITFSTTNGYEAFAFGVANADTVTPFDTHNASSVSADTGSGNVSVNITTDFTHDQLIFGYSGGELESVAVSAGMTTFLGSGSNGAFQPHAAVGYAIKATAQTALTLRFAQVGGTFINRFILGDAIRARILVTGTMNPSEVRDTFSGAGYPQAIGSWTSTEAKDVWAGTGTVPPYGTVDAVEARDTMGFSGDVGRPLGIFATAAAVAHDTDTCIVGLTTTAVDDIIVLGIICGGFWSHSKVATITDTAGLVWKRRHTRTMFGTAPTQEIWWAKKHTPGPTTITVTTFDTTGFMCVDAIAVSGARADHPWDTHSGAGIYNDNFGSGNPTGVIYSNSAKCMGIGFFGSNDINAGTVATGWTALDTCISGETNGQTGRLYSAYQIFTAKQHGTNTISFGQVGGASNNRCIMQDVIVANNDTELLASTDDVIRWFFDGHGNQMILQMSGTNRSAHKEFTTFNPDTTALVAVMVNSSQGARVESVSDTDNHSGWERRSIVTNDVGNKSLELWWVQMADAFSGTVTVTLDENTQPGDILGFIVVGINGPDLFLRGEIFDGHASLPAVDHDDAVSDAHVGPFSTLNENVLEIAVTANTTQDPTGSQADGWLQFVGNFFGSVSGLLVSHSPLFNIALQAKFSGPVVNNDSTTNNQSPSPTDWLMLADALPVGPTSPPQGIWGSTEFKDITTHNGDFTTIGIASPGGWVGFPPNAAVMAAVDQKDRATNTGAFTAIWAMDEGWIGYVPLDISWASTEFKDIYSNYGWVLGPTTILARWESTEPKDHFGFSSMFTWYTTPDSKGDRTSRIVVSTNASLGGSSGVPSTLVNGLRANNAASAIWVNSSQPAPMYFRFDFGSPKVVNEALWFQNGPSAQPGLWNWQGSNDAASWTTLSSAPFVFNGGNSGSPVLGNFGTIPNITAYRYYQVIQTTNAGGNDTPWLWETEFKVAGFSGTMGAVEAKDHMNYQVQLIPTATPIPARKRRLLIVT